MLDFHTLEGVCLSQETNDCETTHPGLPKDQSLACFFHHLFGDGPQVVDLQNPLDLHQEAMDHTKVAASDANNRADSLLIGKIIHTDIHAQMTPTLFE